MLLFFGFSIDGIKVAEIRRFGDVLNLDLLFLLFFLSLCRLCIVHFPQQNQQVSEANLYLNINY